MKNKKIRKLDIKIIVPKKIERQWIDKDGKTAGTGDEMPPEYEKQILAEAKARENKNAWNITEKRQAEIRQWIGHLHTKVDHPCQQSFVHIAPDHPEKFKNDNEAMDYWKKFNALAPATVEEYAFFRYVCDSLLVQEIDKWLSEALKSFTEKMRDFREKPGLDFPFFWDIVCTNNNLNEIARLRKKRREKRCDPTQIKRDRDDLFKRYPETVSMIQAITVLSSEEKLDWNPQEFDKISNPKTGSHIARHIARESADMESGETQTDKATSANTRADARKAVFEQGSERETSDPGKTKPRDELAYLSRPTFQNEDKTNDLIMDLKAIIDTRHADDNLPTIEIAKDILTWFSKNKKDLATLS